MPRELKGLLVDPVEGARPGLLRIEDGRIAAVEPVADDDSGLTAAPLSRLRPAAALRDDPLVFPGFIDLQIYDYARCVEHGVTGYLATVGTSARGVVERFLDELPTEAACLGAHVEGPYLNPEAAGAQAAEHIRPVDPEELDGWLQTGTVRLITLAPEVEGGLEAIERITAAGAVASIGHTATNYYTTRAAVERGATFATHIWNAMSGFRARSPGAIGTLLADERVTLGLIGDGRHLHPVTEELTFRAAGPRAPGADERHGSAAPGAAGRQAPRRRPLRRGSRGEDGSALRPSRRGGDGLPHARPRARARGPRAARAPASAPTSPCSTRISRRARRSWRARAPGLPRGRLGLELASGCFFQPRDDLRGEGRRVLDVDAASRTDHEDLLL